MNLKIFVFFAVLGLAQGIIPLLLAPLVSLGVNKLIQPLVGSIVADATALFKGKSGDITIPKTSIKLHYDVHKCHLHIGKRAFLSSIERCSVTVCERAITNTCKSCTKHHQADALNCAMAAEVSHLQTLAKQ